LYRLANDWNYAVSRPIFNKKLLSGSLKFLSVSVTIAFSTLSLLCDQHSRQMSILHSTTLKRLPLLIFPAPSGKRPSVVCSATLTILLSDLASLQPNRHACLLCCITQGATLFFECFYVKCWETLKKLKEIFDKLTMHLRSLRVLWFFAATYLRIPFFWDMALRQSVTASRPFQTNELTSTDVSYEVTILHRNVVILLPIVAASWPRRTQSVLMF
jgi:hypothetical protein